MKVRTQGWGLVSARANIPIDEPKAEKASAWASLPLSVRIAFCYALFVGFIVVLLPWCASRLDRHVAALSIGLPLAVRIGGGLLLGLGLIGYHVSSHHLTSRGRGAYIEFDPPKQFVASGPFRWCRNPIAASALLIVLGEGLTFSSGGILALFVLGLLLAHLQVVVMEEPLLRKRFGAAYEEYLARVPRWIPRSPRENVP